MPTDRISLTALRKIAREALGKGCGVVDSEPFEGEWECLAGNKHYSIFAFAASKWEARRQLRDLLNTIIAGREMESLRASYRASSEQALKNERELREAKERHG